MSIFSATYVSTFVLLGITRPRRTNVDTEFWGSFVLEWRFCVEFWGSLRFGVEVFRRVLGQLRFGVEVVSASGVFQFTLNVGADSVKFGAQNVSFGMLCCAQFGTLGTIERRRGTWEHTEGDLWGPGLDFYRFWKDFGAAIWTFLANFGTTIVFFILMVFRGSGAMVLQDHPKP